MAVESAAVEGPVADILADLRQYESRKQSIDELFERWAFVLTALLVAAKVVLTITHTLRPFHNGLNAILMLGAAIIGTAVLAQLPLLVRLVMRAVAPNRTSAGQTTQLTNRLTLLEALTKYSPADLARVKLLLVSQDLETTSRLDFLVGPISRLGIIPAIAMLATSYGRLGGIKSDGPISLDALHYATVLTFVLYFAAAVADTSNRRLKFYESVLDHAARRAAK